MVKYKITVLILIILLSSSNLFSAPAISLSEPGYDFGKVIQHTTMTHTFWVKSIGNETLEITQIVPGCGCTEVPLEDSVLAPGDSSKLEIVFSSKAFRGYVTKKPYLITNISDDPVFIEIKAEVLTKTEQLEPLSLTPYKLDVSQFTQKPRRIAKFLIENQSDQDYNLTLLDSSENLFKVSLPDKIKAGETLEGQVEVLKEMTEQQFEKSFTFKINDEKNTRFTMPVRRIYRVLNK